MYCRSYRHHPSHVKIAFEKGCHTSLFNLKKTFSSLPAISLTVLLFLHDQHKRTLEQLSSMAAEKEELSQRCHELDEQVMNPKKKKANGNFF